jgi:hypothetical protein
VRGRGEERSATLCHRGRSSRGSGRGGAVLHDTAPLSRKGGGTIHLHARGAGAVMIGIEVDDRGSVSTSDDSSPPVLRCVRRARGATTAGR